MTENQPESRASRFRSYAEDRLVEAVADMRARYAAQRAAAIKSVPPEVLADLSCAYEVASTPQEQQTVAINVADGITLEAAGTIRRAAKAIELGTPRMIERATADGMTPTEIAQVLGVTDSYVRRIIRERSSET
ncbi:helix-turn-helix domain-containing protein [Streptomyces californicus]